MKCDELKSFNCVASDLQEFCEPRLVYHKSEVDSAIDEMKRDHHNERDEYIDWVNKLQKENEELKRMVTTDNSAVIARLEDELRKFKRALWLARAERAKEMCKRLLIQGFDPKWEKVERKCRAKAEQYK